MGSPTATTTHAAGPERSAEPLWRQQYERYNWQINADNRGQDWYFESIGDTSAMAGERGDTFITMSKARGRAGRDHDPDDRLGGEARHEPRQARQFLQAKYGAQTGNDWQWFPDAGNGILNSTGQNVTGNDPNDANVAADSAISEAVGAAPGRHAGARRRTAA